MTPMVSSPARALAAADWLCLGCRREWNNYSPWEVRDTLRDFPRFVREYWRDEILPAFIIGMGCVVLSAPLWLFIEAVRGPRCPCCDGRLAAPAAKGGR